MSSLIGTHHATQETTAAQEGGADIAGSSGFEREAEIPHFYVGFPKF